MQDNKAVESFFFSATKAELCRPALRRKSRPRGRLCRGKGEQIFHRRREIRNDNGNRLQGHDRKHWKTKPNTEYMWLV